VADSHFISRSLLRNWERRPGELHYFDFRDCRVKPSSAKAMYVSEKPYPDDVEMWLDRTIESPLGDYLKKCRLTLVAGVRNMPKPVDREARALRLAVALQGPRTALAKTGDRTLIDLVRMGDGFFDEFVKVQDHSVNSYVVAFGAERLHFPTVGRVRLPMIGAFALFLPMTPGLFAISTPKAFDRDTLDRILGALEGWPTALSVGLHSERVVLPPDGSDPAVVASAVPFLRAQAKALHERLRQLNARIGADPREAWRPESPLSRRYVAELLRTLDAQRKSK